MPDPLEQVRIVLVETSHPGNIGATARAMKNMGLSQLVLVRPREFPHEMATARASGADDVLAAARVVDDLDTALADCIRVYGASARERSLGSPVLEPRAAAADMAEQVAAGPVAVLFGRENNGLSNAELERCHYHIHIPSNPAYSSLNIAAAVQVISYEIYQALRQPPPVDTPPRDEAELPATMAELEQLYAHMESTLTGLGLIDPDNPMHLMRRLRHLVNRAGPDRREVKILRGILSAVDKVRRDR